ncbi:hypothetical protein KVR01_013386 [Diaporthe batatas]|uniref:uncharacterized protein n=1 Tax=Diaporthe batatas TaxID=748121 RepID=UPI001D055A9D|nr:uncharacterized protein KVR01_013386 [Diaporthe batatas]KAG8156781.1 hypothetical protein KVR01_013386 [Diaporthe batatas]
MVNATRKLTQSGHPHDEPDLQSLSGNLPPMIDDEPEQIVYAFETGLKSISHQTSSSVSVHEAAQVFFTKIQTILPLSTDKNRNAFFFENLASIFMCIAQQTPSRNIGQELLVGTVRLMTESPEETWREGFLVAQKIRMRDGWCGFTLEEGHEADEVLSPDEWLNLNSFNARLFGSGLNRWINFPIWQLREGLEDRFGADADENDCKVAVACEWVIQAGRRILYETLQNQEYDKAEKRSYRGLNLFTGYPGLNTERWGFWKRRLDEVKPEVKTQLTLRYVEDAKRAMKTIEKDSASRALG